MPKVTIKIEKDRTNEILQALDSIVPVAFEAIGSEAATYAIKDCPVDTSNLKNSITWATATGHGGGSGAGGGSTPLATPEKLSVYIGSNVNYAVYQEYGDYNHTVGKKHFLRDAVANHRDHYKEILEAALKA